MRLADGDGRENRGRRVDSGLEEVAPCSVEFVGFPHGPWFSSKPHPRSSRRRDHPGDGAGGGNPDERLAPGCSELNLPETLDNCERKYLLTTVLPKLYRRTVGG